MASLSQKIKKKLQKEALPEELTSAIEYVPEQGTNQLSEFFLQEDAITQSVSENNILQPVAEEKLVVEEKPVVEENFEIDPVEEVSPDVVFEPPQFRWNDILIVGDSFAMHRDELTDWPRYLVNKLCNQNDKHRKIRGKGFTGCSWWSTRREIISEFSYSVPKVLIITHTEMQRIPSDENFPLNTATVFNDEYYSKYKHAKEDYVPLDILKAGQEYYRHLFIQDFHMWAQQRWFNELDELASRYGVPYVIHLHSFDGWNKDQLIWPFRYGVTFNKSLWPLSDDNKKFENAKWKNTDAGISIPDADLWQSLGTRNHFLPENNIKLAESIYHTILHNYSSGVMAPLNLD